MTKCKKKNILVDRAAFIIDFVGNLRARDLKDEGFTKLCDSLVKKKKRMCCGLNNQNNAEG